MSADVADGSIASFTTARLRPALGSIAAEGWTFRIVRSHARSRPRPTGRDKSIRAAFAIRISPHGARRGDVRTAKYGLVASETPAGPKNCRASEPTGRRTIATCPG